VFSFRIAQQFKRHAAGMIASSRRGAVPTSAAIDPTVDNNRIGAYAALGAITLGAVMLMANIAHNRAASLPAASVANVSDTSYGAIAVKPLAAPQPDATPIAVAPATPVPSPVAAAEKSAARVDMSTTGAIASPAPAHPKHKAHPKKPKDVDSKP
jgi:hypothetical protein